MTRADIFCEFFLELHGPLSGGEPARAQAFRDVRNFFVINQWAMKGDEIVRHNVVLPVVFFSRPNG
jgi:hypothetical protein